MGWVGRVAAKAIDQPESLAGRLLSPALRVWANSLEQPRLVPLEGKPCAVYIAPANWAGQGYLWARSLEANHPALQAVSMATTSKADYSFVTDIAVSPPVYNLSSRWHASQLEYLSGFTHVLIEAERPLFGERYGHDPFVEARMLIERGMEVAMICHGHDIRLPSRNIATERWSPYAASEHADLFERVALRNRAGLDGLGAPVFVSTPDLLVDVPYAMWLPLVVDVSRWASDRPVSDRSRPRIVHVPSSSALKGTHLIAETMNGFANDGIVEYVLAENLKSKDMPAIYGSADVVLDQFMVGSYGVAACEAMAAGRIVIGHVSEQVREHVKTFTGFDVPIVEATVETLHDVIVDIIGNPSAYSHVGAAGVAFVTAVHDGRKAARVLGAFVGASTAEP